jgi:hypothetical protein
VSTEGERNSNAPGKNDPLFSGGHNISLGKIFKSNSMPGNDRLLG